MIELAKKRQIEVIERRIYPEELEKASEIFVTGTAAEVTPVGEIDGQTFTVGEITRKLMDDYDQLVGNKRENAASAA